ncbi:Zf-FLZ domain-containing protein [Dioscorea alata]|uniref:Zf-FLZ domain-containing protein n=2 Tax=Dioscorea alata TaxID=55571 RepID=A0ACB7TYW8_DIOAL|nr:Zf-FLZ domain-containing protein [Dioscorea alata]KAH7653262.1 Zf-FLZ domain-containing protein [Dioscorea alata]
MLKKRSRTVSSSSSKQSLQSPTGKYNRMASSSLFPSPRLFVGFSSKGFTDTEPAAMSPTSILETKPFSSIGNPFFSDRNPRKPVNETNVPLESNKHHHPWDNGDSKAIGLGIIDALTNEKANDKSSKQDSRMVLFGSQLKIQVPYINSGPISPTCSVESPNSPIEFGIKTKDSQLALYSPPPATPRIFSGCFSPRDMELSEDYTCIISHGPNPKTTHIFDNCIVESCGDGYPQSMADRTMYPSDDFLSFCYACKKNLGHGKDIFMYGGEKAFCSRECRYQEMLFDEEVTDDKSLAEQMRPL